MFIAQSSVAQVAHKWLALGDLQNFYASFGTEIELGFINRQQAGLAWPGIYQFQDAQASKAMWLGVKNFTDQNGVNFDYKVVHSGPRVRADAYFFPVEYYLISKKEATKVSVDEVLSERVEQTVDSVDANIPGDRMIYAKFNTAIGVTVERKIHQFSQQYHDDYHIIEVTLTNTGFTSKEETNPLNRTINDLIFYEFNRWAPVLQTRYMIGNATGWGINTMNDRRGDGLNSSGSPTENEFKAQYAWQGKFAAYTPPLPDADNLGAPIIVPNTVNGYMSASDTSGRLGAYHFVGKVHLHADKSATDKSNDPNQPLTMSEIDSDNSNTFNNDPENRTRMSVEYEEFMNAGVTPRQAYLVEPTGDAGFITPKGNPALGTTGGWSAATGYGPYTLQPGESVTIVYAEAVGGIGHQHARVVGAKYKADLLNPAVNNQAANLEKNTEMFKGRDSLFQTFRRAIANYNSGYQLRQAPPAPISVDITSTGNGILINWDYNDADESLIDGFEVYRSPYLPDSTAKLIATLDVGDREFVDGDDTPAGAPIRGVNYFYYVTAVGKPDNTLDPALTPAGVLRSSRYFTQSYDYARLLRPPGTSMDQIRIVPNPYIAKNVDALRLGVEGDERIAFFEIPNKTSIKIYNELGQFIQEINEERKGDAFWDFRTVSRQRVVSGIYIAVIKNLETGEEIIKKFVVLL